MESTVAQIMQMRALGYSQNEIAKSLDMTQSAVSQRIKTIRKKVENPNNVTGDFWKLLIAAGGTILLMKLFEEFRKEYSV